MKQISFKMDDILYEQIKEASRREERNISELIRVSLKEHFEKERKKDNEK